MWIMTDRGWQRIVTQVTPTNDAPASKLRNGYLARTYKDQLTELCLMNVHSDDGKVLL